MAAITSDRTLSCIGSRSRSYSSESVFRAFFLSDARAHATALDAPQCALSNAPHHVAFRPSIARGRLRETGAFIETGLGKRTEPSEKSIEKAGEKKGNDEAASAQTHAAAEFAITKFFPRKNPLGP